MNCYLESIKDISKYSTLKPPVSLTLTSSQREMTSMI
jgi:hypothetical protein